MFERKGEFNFVLIGAKSTGKTWYIKYLAKKTRLVTIMDDKTIDYIDTISQSENETKATNISYTELYFNFKNETYNIDFQIDDYDGNFVETWHDSKVNKEYKDKLAEYVRESEGVFVFLPYESKDDTVRFDRMQKETDVFINRIKEEYGEEHSELPIPVIIVVSKWDNSPGFGTGNENDKAKEYIETNDTLRLIKDKLENHFEKIDIIPLSAKKDYNITLPIEMSLDYTFKNWENRIAKLKDKEEDLLIFLSTVMYDIRFYKDQKYKKIFDELEAKIAPGYIKNLENLKSIKEFDNFCNDSVYKDAKDRNILDSFSEKYLKKIDNIENKLLKKEKRKKYLAIAVSLIILSGIGFGYSKYKSHKEEDKLFNNIQTEYENKNYSATLSNINKYYNEFSNIDKMHYADLKLLEEKTKAKYRETIDEALAGLPENRSIVKAYNIIEEIHIKAKEYGIPSIKQSLIEKEFFRLDEIKKAYDTLNNEIDKLSLNDISKEIIDGIAMNTNKLIGFEEHGVVTKKFDKKLKIILNASLESDDEKTVLLMYNLASTMKISDDKRYALQKKLQDIKLETEFNEYLRSIKNEKDLEALIKYISNNWNTKYDKSKQAKVGNIVKNKFNSWAKEHLKYAPKNVYNVDDFNRLLNYLNNTLAKDQEIQGLPIGITDLMSTENKKQHQTKLNLYNRYNNIFKNGIATTSFTFYAEKGNDLGVTPSDDEIIIFIDNNKTYSYKNSGGFSTFSNSGGKGRMIFNSKHTYKAGRYDLTIKEIDIAYDDIKTDTFTISKNQLIELENKGKLLIDLGSIYDIEISK